MDMDAKAWLNVTTEIANDTSKWFERDLDDFLKEIHRDNDEPDPTKQEEDEDKMKTLIPDQSGKFWKSVDQMMDKFDNPNGQLLWDFDVFEYELDEPMALYGSIPLMVSAARAAPPAAPPVPHRRPRSPSRRAASPRLLPHRVARPLRRRHRRRLLAQRRRDVRRYRRG